VKQYESVPGFCKSAALEEIRNHRFVLTPGRYVGSEDADSDAVPFEERFGELGALLDKQFSEALRLQKLISDKLALIDAK
jgi:type I restriction enzyme M protein